MLGAFSTEMIPLIIAIFALIGTLLSTAYIIVNVKNLRQQQEEMEQKKHQYKETVEKELDIELEKERQKAPRRMRSTREPSSDFVPKARIAWMNQTKNYTGEVITYGAAIFQASKRIIQNNIEIKENTANNYTYKDKNINIAKYNENLEKFKISKAKLQLSYVHDSDVQDILNSLDNIDKLRRTEYGTQIHSNIEKHEELYEAYTQEIDRFIQLSTEYFDNEWEKIKRGR